MAHSAKPWVVLDLRETEECLSVCCWDEGNIVCRIKNTVNQKPLNKPHVVPIGVGLTKSSTATLAPSPAAACLIF
jgi:hypothetical protein